MGGRPGTFQRVHHGLLRGVLVARSSVKLLDHPAARQWHAHQVALRTEQAAVRAAGIAWRDYNRFTKAHEKQIGDERLTRAPRDLDLTPYRDEHDLPELRKIIAASSAREKAASPASGWNA
jgi:hypothetical protein